MARIRSVHPGLFTDEAFVSCSSFARLLAIGIWCECDDQGVFEWKPLTLKMRLLPADTVDVAALMEEMADAGLCRRFEVAGRSYGAIRNFQKYQRPKKPNSVHPLPNELRTYVGAKEHGSEAVGNQFPTEPEKSPQMEEVGGREDTEPDGSGAADASPDVVEDLKSAIFGPCRDWLMDRTGRSKNAVCGWLGKASSAIGDAALLGLLLEAKRQDVHEPIAWMQARINPPKGQPKMPWEQKFSTMELLQEIADDDRSRRAGAAHRHGPDDYALPRAVAH